MQRAFRLYESAIDIPNNPFDKRGLKLYSTSA